MRSTRLIAAALAVAAVAGGGHAALAQEDGGERSAETSSRLLREQGYYGTFTVRATRVSDSEVRIRASATLERPERVNGFVRIHCRTQESVGETFCGEELALPIEAGTRQQRTCRTVRVRRDGRLRRVRRCRTRTVPRESVVETTVRGANPDGSPAHVYEVVAYLYDEERQQAISSSGRLAVPR